MLAHLDPYLAAIAGSFGINTDRLPSPGSCAPLVDGSVIESFWDGGRARTASRAYPQAVAKEQLGLAISATSGGGGKAVKGVTVDVEVFEMGNAWLEPIE